MSIKIIKDSVHGYIELDNRSSNIIDSPEFQRLKYIEQGSFRVLYPAARHDRFIHSLGTYYLAKKFGSHFIENVRHDLNLDLEDELINCVTNSFYYASLLHDIGHAPFSHTTEEFFQRKTKNNKSVIEGQLFDSIKNIVNNNEIYLKFENDYTLCSPSPHEIMSATILIKKGKDFLGKDIQNVDLELSARMVLGCTYDYNEINHDDDKSKIEYGIKNCFIRLLNSQTVDVDKLDYITRDTQMSGFFNVPIDIERLFSSVTAVIVDDGFIYPAFRKNSLSVIDNVFRAKTEQSLWMVSHPIVKYDSELLSNCINSLQKHISNEYIEDVFSLNSIGVDGISVKGKRYRLICDADIHSDLRCFYDDCGLIQELYDRKSRRRPIWKSYYEYKYLFDEICDSSNGEDLNLRFFKPLIDAMRTSKIFVLNNETYTIITNSKENSNRIKDAASFLKEFCETESIKFDLTLILSTGAFSSSFNPDKVYITFPKLPNRENKNYETYTFLKNPSNNENKPFFYIYSKQKFSSENIDKLKKAIIYKIKKKKDRV